LVVFSVDEFLQGISPDMSKIDVEGMGISVLHGLADVIQRKRPMLFIEVDIENDDAFLGWVDKNEYAF
jgi:hypothetical protein